MHLIRVLFSMAALLILGSVLSGCGGGGGTSDTQTPLPPIDGTVQVGPADVSFTPAASVANAVNFVTADFESKDDIAALSRAKHLIPDVPFTYDDLTKTWSLSFSKENHPQKMGQYGAAQGQYYMTIYVLLTGETTRRQVDTRRLVNLDIPASAETDPDDGSGPPPPPWSD
ncbi:MAG TPA: hypothetical protein PLZ36_11535 [Armatimonadota bacterium]|nr:hypothetical protein [Armatimonadota bacterium]